MQVHTIRLAGLLVLTCAVLAGCTGTPEQLGVESLKDRTGIERWAGSVWDVVQASEPSGARKPRIAIAEFSVEYVGNTEESATQNVNLSRGLAVQLPTTLYHAFVDTMPEFDLMPVPLEDVMDSRAYEGIQGTSLGDIDLVEGNLTDYTYPADGLRVIEQDQPGAQAALNALLSEVNADAVLQVHLRVGLHGGRGVIARGSTFRVTNKHGVGLMKSRVAIVSAGPVVDPAASSVDSSVMHVNSAHFSREVRAVFRPYISMALHATR